MEDFNSKYTGAEVENLLDQVASGNVGGGTTPDLSQYATKQDLESKVDKVEGKQLSTEDFTTALKQRLEGLTNYDDSEISEAVNQLREDFDTLVSGDSTTAIKTFNEIIAFLSGIEDSESLDSIIASIEQKVAAKVDKDTLSKVATSGSYDDLKDTPTIPAEQVNADWNATSGKAQILNKPTIPEAVTVDTALSTTSTNPVQNKAVANGINAKYTKPSTGIPKTDLATAVQTSLGKADTALQSYTEQYKGTVTSVKINGSTKTPDANGLVDLGTSESEGGDYLPTTGGTVEGDVEVIGTLFADSVSSSSYTNENGTKFKFTDRGIFIYRAAGGTTPTLQVRTDQDENKFLAGDGTYKSTAYPLVNHGTSDTTFTLTPNTLHVWGAVSSLTLSLGTEQSGVANEFLFQFTCGTTATTLSLPDTIKWQEELAIEANKIYQISILNGLASVLTFDNA